MCNTDCASYHTRADSGGQIGGPLGWSIGQGVPIHIVQRYVEFHEDKYCSSAVQTLLEFCSRILFANIVRGQLMSAGHLNRLEKASATFCFDDYCLF